MNEIIFLLSLAFIWLTFAAISDLRKTEIPNWLNFSFIIFALGFRFFYSLFSLNNFNFFYQGLIGFGIFLIIGNLLYYGKLFAGGDAKILYALGALLPLSNNFLLNVEIFVSFIFLFLFIGAIYGILISGYLAITNFKDFKKEFSKIYKSKLIINISIMIFAILIMILGIFINNILVYSGILIFFMPLLYIFSKSVDEACMKKRILPRNLRLGDWLYEDVTINNKVIKANWDGLTNKDISILKKKRKYVTIRQGIPFAPVFLFSFIAFIYLYFINTGLWYSFW